MEPNRPCPANCELFGRNADFFESKVVPLWQDVYNSLVARAGITSGSRVLDAGTGTGEVALRVSHVVGLRGLVVAVDSQEEMLKIARVKAKHLGGRNIRFKQMQLEALDLPDAAFDTVVGNYSLCCCLSYKASLAGCLRVLKPGGRLTYNHGGPGDPLESQIIFNVFERYKTRNPTKKLREIRESEASQIEAVEKYRDPFVALALMRSLGYGEATAAITQRVVRYHTPEDFVERMLAFDWRSEADEIPEADLHKFRREATSALNSVARGPGFTVKDQMIFFSGLKR